MEILAVKNTITNMKISIKGLDSTLKLAEELANWGYINYGLCQKQKKEWKKLTASEKCGILLSASTYAKWSTERRRQRGKGIEKYSKK